MWSTVCNLSGSQRCRIIHFSRIRYVAPTAVDQVTSIVARRIISD